MAHIFRAADDYHLFIRILSLRIQNSEHFIQLFLTTGGCLL